MRTFEEIQNELKSVCEYKLEKIANDIPHKTDYFVAVEKELQNILNDSKLLAIKTDERILNGIQHVIDMANARKPIEDILKFSQLGITPQDYDIIEKITKCRYSPNNLVLMDDLKNSILEYYSVQKELSESDSRSM